MALDSSDRIHAVLPLFFVKNLTDKKLVSIPYSSHGGFIGDADYIPILIKKIFELKKKLNCSHIEIRQPPSSIVYKNKLEEAGMTSFENRVNHFINPMDTSLDELWNNLSSKNRGAIRKARKKNVTVEKITKEKEIKYIYKLETINRRYRGLPTPRINYYKNMWKELNPKNYIEILVAKHNDKYIAYAIFFKFKNKVVHVHVGSDDLGKKLGANNLILWTALENCCKDGCDFFDFGASALDGRGNVTEEFKGVYFYKCSFNTTNLPYSWYYYPKNCKGMDSVSKPSSFSKFGSDVFRFMPMPLYKKTGTFFIKKFM